MTKNIAVLATFFLAACSCDEPFKPDAAPLLPAPNGTVYVCHVNADPRWFNEYCWDQHEGAIEVPDHTCFPETTGIMQCNYNCVDPTACGTFNGCWCPQ